MSSEEHAEGTPAGRDVADPADRGGDPTAVPAAAGLFLLAVGGWCLNTTRPWHKPGHPVVLGLGWAAGLAMLLSGLVLLARCVRAVHRGGDGPGGRPDRPAAP